MRHQEIQQLKIGDLVEVQDEGLEMLRKICPDQPLNNIGEIKGFTPSGDVEVWFKLSGENHSQASLYPRGKVKKINP